MARHQPSNTVPAGPNRAPVASLRRMSNKLGLFNGPRTENCKLVTGGVYMQELR